MAGGGRRARAGLDAASAAFAGMAAADADAPCRPHCGACCTAPSISSPIPGFGGIPGMPDGKPAGVACVQLDAQLRCRLFGRPERPAVCASLRPSAAMCGASRTQAMAMLDALERATRPD